MKWIRSFRSRFSVFCAFAFLARDRYTIAHFTSHTLCRIDLTRSLCDLDQLISRRLIYGTVVELWSSMELPLCLYPSRDENYYIYFKMMMFFIILCFYDLLYRLTSVPLFLILFAFVTSLYHGLFHSLFSCINTNIDFCFWSCFLIMLHKWATSLFEKEAYVYYFCCVCSRMRGTQRILLRWMKYVAKLCEKMQ